MLMTRMLSRLSRSVGQRSLHLCSPSQNHHLLLIPSNQFHEYPNKCITRKVCLFHHSVLNSSLFQNFGFTSSASPEPGEKEQGSAVENNGAPTDAKSEETNGSAKLSDPTKVSVSRETEESDAEAVSDLSMDDLVKLVMEKEELLKEKHKEIETMQDKVLRTYAEMENVKERTKREAENSKKFAIQNFAKSLLDVADNLGRASSVVKGNFSKINVSNDAADVVPLLKTLLEGVEMTEKQLGEVFKKYGVEKFDPINEPFDPHRHNAIFEVPDALKPPGIVAAVLKAGYMLHERVIRPAEVGVTRAVEKDL
ncbi:grpE protein homolog 1, mitochondrial [Populus alba]|uniref:GrpE protein homolog n=1 Tax=Populus alba TaxID=43335 RepID=A0A4U5P5M1_POPAL|nr:grpE protein homolog 2, mitochondrial-like [Populus alba]TKR91538.1 grpE protein-like, mitochondrial-like [Populus alba]